MTHNDHLRALGRAMFGPQWQSELARAIGRNSRTIRRYDAGSPVPDAVMERVIAAAEDRRNNLTAAIDAAERTTP